MNISILKLSIQLENDCHRFSDWQQFYEYLFKECGDSPEYKTAERMTREINQKLELNSAAHPFKYIGFSFCTNKDGALVTYDVILHKDFKLS